MSLFEIKRMKCDIRNEAAERGRREQVNAKISTYMRIYWMGRSKAKCVHMCLWEKQSIYRIELAALDIINGITTTNADDNIFFQHLYCRAHCAVCVLREAHIAALAMIICCCIL